MDRFEIAIIIEDAAAKYTYSAQAYRILRHRFEKKKLL